jgi:hypothetical protein
MLEIELQGKLNHARVIARRDDPTKIAWVDNLSSDCSNASA